MNSPDKYAAMRADLARKTMRELRAIARAEGITLGYDGAPCTRWHELFGTAERAARTLCDVVSCVEAANDCDACEFSSLCARTGDYDELLEWLEGDAE